MATEMARGIVAQAWCQKKTSKMEMDGVLAEEFAKILDKYIDALIWCSGSYDFSYPNGTSRKGWEKICEPLLRMPKEKPRQ